MPHSSSFLCSLLLFTLSRTKARLPVQKSSRAAGQDIIFPETMLLGGLKSLVSLGLDQSSLKIQPILSVLFGSFSMDQFSIV